MPGRPAPPSSAPRLGWRPFAPALVIGLVIALVLALTPGAPAGPASGRWVSADLWTNGVLNVALTPDRPAATVSGASAGASYGLYAGVSAVDEVTPNGTVVASANLDRSNWTITNDSTPAGLALSYRSSLAVVPAAGGPSEGSTTVLINFSASSSGPDDPTSAALDLGVVVLGWPWISSSDRWAIDMPLWPQDTSVAYLEGAPGAANLIHCLARDNDAAVASFTWEPNATAIGPNHSSAPLTAVTHLVGDTSLTTVQVVFVGPTVGAGTLFYDPQVSVPAPTLPVSLPTLDYVGAFALAAVGAGVGLIAARSSWNRPPSLERTG